MRRYILGIFLVFLCFNPFEKICSQIKNGDDSVSFRLLDSIVVTSSLRLNATPYLRNIEGFSVLAGKKTNNIILDQAKANLAGATTRMIFSQVPGVTLWDMSGTGGQVNIGSRGTDAHRAIEMNVRQNGYNVNSDVFGYPEAHYTAAMEGVQRIELVRGSAALQFGPQFGGMINYVMKEGDSTKPLSIESEQTGGSSGFFNSFNSIGGAKGKWRYYAYYNNRHGDGWRDNSAFVYRSYYGNLQYEFSDKASLSLQFSRMDYREQIAGGLTDIQFTQNSRTSTRTRNFFSPIINIPALAFNYKFGEQTKIQLTTHYLTGERNSVQYLNPPNIADTINTLIASYNPRQVDRDYYNGFTIEGRLLHSYSMGRTKGTLATGVRFYDQVTKRRQKGTGTTGNDFNLTLVRPYGIDLKLHSTNYAAFAENIFQLTDKLTVTPGVRYENIETGMTGLINNATVPVNYTSARKFPLFGMGVEYNATKDTRLYGNISQAYRPFLYANVTPADRIDIIDPELKDSKGYDIDLGYRGSVGNILKFDVNGYYLFYGNRVGQLTQTNESASTYLFTTNIGDAVSKGVEAYVSISFGRLLLPSYFSTTVYKLRLFNSLSYTHATYKTAIQNLGGTNVQLSRKWIENTPRWMNRTGLAWQHKMFIIQLTFTYVGKSFSDANNTVSSPNGVTGIVPAYQLWDVSANWRFSRTFSVSAGINNIANTKYFSRRISMYPGPGILPADGRSWYIGLGVKI
jgi:Fe(3+) dicitrate transport protein